MAEFLQVLSGPSSKRISAYQVGIDMVQKEGWRAAWAGLTARILTIAPGCAVTWAVYEEIKTFLVRSGY
jgi:Mitochondrial carrier protein